MPTRDPNPWNKFSPFIFSAFTLITPVTTGQVKVAVKDIVRQCLLNNDGDECEYHVRPLNVHVFRINYFHMPFRLYFDNFGQNRAETHYQSCCRITISMVWKWQKQN
jgi:hypothetical protein